MYVYLKYIAEQVSVLRTNRISYQLSLHEFIYAICCKIIEFCLNIMALLSMNIMVYYCSYNYLVDIADQVFALRTVMISSYLSVYGPRPT